MNIYLQDLNACIILSLSSFGSATTMSLANSSLCHTRVSLLRPHEGVKDACRGVRTMEKPDTLLN